MDSQHTTEPWEVSRYIRSNGETPRTPEDLIEILSESVRKSPGLELFGVAMEGSGNVVICYTGNGPTSLENAYRIVACVNACAGMADPVAELSALRSELAAAKEQSDRQQAALERCRKANDCAVCDEGITGETYHKFDLYQAERAKREKAEADLAAMRKELSLARKDADAGWGRVEEVKQKLEADLAAMTSKADLWQRQSAFESDHRERYLTALVAARKAMGEKDAAARDLIDEAERVYHAALEDGRKLIHFGRAIERVKAALPAGRR
jgi:hypothetical protein